MSGDVRFARRLLSAVRCVRDASGDFHTPCANIFGGRGVAGSWRGGAERAIFSEQGEHDGSTRTAGHGKRGGAARQDFTGAASASTATGSGVTRQGRFQRNDITSLPSVKQFLKDARKAERERIKATRAQFLTSKKGASL